MARLAPRLTPDMARRKPSEAGRVGVDGSERVVPALDFVLRFAGAKCSGQAAPERVEAEVGHFEDAADVRGLPLVQKETGLRRVAIDAAGAFEKAKGDQGIEKIARAARVQPEPLLECGEIPGLFRQGGEQFQFHSAEECLRTPEREAGLQDVVGRG